MPVRARPPASDYFLWTRTQSSIRVWLHSALRCLDQGAAGGGAPARFDGDAPLYAQLLLWYLGLWMRLAGIAGGAFLFCTRDAFHAAGGFDERLFGAEDAAMSWALKREGRFVVLWRYVLTSGRRMRGMRGPQMLAGLVRMAFFPGMLTQRSAVKKIWYESNREDGRKILNSLAAQVFNVLLLLVAVVMITDPLIDHVPWLQTINAGPLWHRQICRQPGSCSCLFLRCFAGPAPGFFCAACFNKRDGLSGLNWLACSPWTCGLPGRAHKGLFGFGRGFGKR